MNASKKFDLTLLATKIFEKEVLIFCYFALFSFLSADDVLNIQLLLFLVGTVLQTLLKLKSKLVPWNNFVALLFFVIGTAANYHVSYLSKGFFTYLLLISVLSFSYEKWYKRIRKGLLSFMLNVVYSAAVMSSFPTLYALFLKNKLGISITEFVFNDTEHFAVVSGYVVFYVLLLIHKQLVTLQNHLLRASGSSSK